MGVYVKEPNPNKPAMGELDLFKLYNCALIYNEESKDIAYFTFRQMARSLNPTIEDTKIIVFDGSGSSDMVATVIELVPKKKQWAVQSYIHRADRTPSPSKIRKKGTREMCEAFMMKFIRATSARYHFLEVRSFS